MMDYELFFTNWLGTEIYINFHQLPCFSLCDILDSFSRFWNPSLSSSWVFHPVLTSQFVRSRYSLFRDRNLSDSSWFYCPLTEFEEWFSSYRPNKDSGWVTKFEEWEFNNRGIIPRELHHKLPKNWVVEDSSFIEIVNPNDLSKTMIDYAHKAIRGDICLDTKIYNYRKDQLYFLLHQNNI